MCYPQFHEIGMAGVRQCARNGLKNQERAIALGKLGKVQCVDDAIALVVENCVVLGICAFGSVSELKTRIVQGVVSAITIGVSEEAKDTLRGKLADYVISSRRAVSVTIEIVSKGCHTRGINSKAVVAISQ